LTILLCRRLFWSAALLSLQNANTNVTNDDVTQFFCSSWDSGIA